MMIPTPSLTASLPYFIARLASSRLVELTVAW